MTMLRFLLLEDSAIDADLIQAVLLEGELNCELVQVQTREDFVAAIAQHDLDLILADYSLPAFDGFSALQIAQVECPDVPFIFVSGTLGEEVAVEMLKSGATDYVVKQRLDRLIPSVQRALKEAEERTARKQAEAKLVKYANRLQMLAETSRSFAEGILDFQTLLDIVCRKIGELIGEICILHLVADDGQWLQMRAIYYPGSEAIASLESFADIATASQSTQQGLAIEILQTQKSLLLPAIADADLQDFIQAKDLPYLKRFSVSSLMIVPLQVRGRSIGSLSLIRETPNRPYTSEDQTFLQALADRAALAIDNARLYKKSQEANRIKDEFLAMLSHELRSPLNAMIGWLSLLRSRQFDAATTTRALETVERNARAQARLVEDLLDVSRILQGKLRLDLRPLKLGSMIEAAIDTVRPLADVKEIQLQVSLDLQVGQVAGDAERLQQIIWNLLSNAVKFTPRGGRVEVQLALVASQVAMAAETARGEGQAQNSCGSWAQIRVSDTGQGIKPEFLPHVFDRFRQADSSITRMHGGLGLGLAIVHHLVKLHGGSVEAHSEGEGQGATFIVNLPLLTPAPSLKQSQPTLLDTAPLDLFGYSSQLHGLRILIIDDDLDAQILLQSILQGCGAEVVAAVSANEGFSTLTSSAKPFDLLISDIGMPGEDGYTFLRRVRSLQVEQGGQIPAIAITAYAREEDRQAALAAGFQSHLPKPIDPTQLVTLIADLVRQTETQPALSPRL